MAVSWDQLDTAQKRTDFISGSIILEAERQILRLRASKQTALNREITDTYTAAVRDARVAAIQKRLDEAEADHEGLIAWRNGGGTPPA
jgi:hypothetical protein